MIKDWKEALPFIDSINYQDEVTVPIYSTANKINSI